MRFLETGSFEVAWSLTPLCCKDVGFWGALRANSAGGNFACTIDFACARARNLCPDLLVPTFVYLIVGYDAREHRGNGAIGAGSFHKGGPVS